MSNAKHRGTRRRRLGELIQSIDAGVSVRSHDKPAGMGRKGVLKTSALSKGRFNPDENKLIRADDLERARITPKSGCTLVSRMNTRALVGESAYIDRDWPDLYLPDRIWQIHPADDVDPEWLALVIGSEPVRSALRNGASGTSGSMKNISQGQLRDVRIVAPELVGQRRAAAVVGRCDHASRLLSELLTAKRAFKRALMQELLIGRRRFREFEAEPFRAVRLGDVCDIKIGGTPSRATSLYWASVGEGFPWVTISDLRRMKVSDTKERITEEGIRNSNVKLIPAGTALMSFKLTIGRTALAGCDLYTNEAIAALTLKDGQVLPRYLYEVLPLAVRSVNPDSAVKGATLNKRKLADMLLKVPNPAEQTLICRVAESLDRDIAVSESMLEAHRALKRGLIDRLLFGDLDLPEPLAAGTAVTTPDAGGNDDYS